MKYWGYHYSILVKDAEALEVVHKADGRRLRQDQTLTEALRSASNPVKGMPQQPSARGQSPAG